MFTGIVRDLGTVEALVETGVGARRLVLRTLLPDEDLQPGASVACNGTCLTVVSREAGSLVSFDVGPETLARSRWGGATVGDRVNLEPALRLDGALGGHMISGHVDGLARVTQAHASSADFWHLEAELPAPIAHWLLPQGSIALAGVSLTLAEVSPAAADGSRRFTVMLIPETLRSTNLGSLGVGDLVEVEADQNIKAIDTLIARRLQATCRA